MFQNVCIYIYICKKCVWDKERETMKMEREKKIVRCSDVAGDDYS